MDDFVIARKRHTRRIRLDCDMSESSTIAASTITKIEAPSVHFLSHLTFLTEEQEKRGGGALILP